MVMLSDLTLYLNQLLRPDLFKDYCPNGLQIEGRPQVLTLISGVTANQALIDAAIDSKADAILVHHGFFWKNEETCLVGMKYRRIRSLLVNDISLLAYHLPLDAHLLYGNNIQLGHLLGLEFLKTFPIEPGLELGFIGHLKRPLSGECLADLIAEKLSRRPLHIQNTSRLIKTVAWCSGAGQDYMLNAIAQQADAYLTGEASERTFHIARENPIHFYAAGHHATEKYGVIALGNHLRDKFNLKHYFIDIDNPL
jgi:dinuclear metal center YbgI/SA1388 family protein